MIKRRDPLPSAEHEVRHWRVRIGLDRRRRACIAKHRRRSPIVRVDRLADGIAHQQKDSTVLRLRRQRHRQPQTVGVTAATEIDVKSRTG